MAFSSHLSLWIVRRMCLPQRMQSNNSHSCILHRPILQGIGFGIIFPAYNSLYINLAPNNRRATATSTYLTSWDVGIGLGMVVGGMIAQSISFSAVYSTGAVLSIISMLIFDYIVTPHYKKNRLR